MFQSFRNHKSNIILLVCVFVLMYMSLTHIRHINYDIHFKMAINLFESYYHVSAYPFMHLILMGLNKIIGGIGWKLIFSIVIFLSYLFRFLIVRNYLEFSNFKNNTILFSLFSILIFAPFYMSNHRLGLILPNMISAPTTIFTFPFSLFLYFYTSKHIENLQTKNFVMISIIALFVAFSKPTFLISYMPALVLWILFINKDQFINKSKAQLFLYVLPLLLIVGVGAYTVTKGYYNIGIKPFYVWGFYAKNSIIKMLGNFFLSLIFPIYLFSLIKQTRTPMNLRLKFASIIFLVSFSISIIFYDDYRMESANFLQQTNIPFNLFLIECTIFYFLNFKKDIFGKILLSTYLVFGIHFIYQQTIMSDFWNLIF